MNYKISIIIPVFNAENNIKEALESVLKQSIGFEHLEVIMVDDCSSDTSGKIIDEYAEKYGNFKAIHLKENSGAPGKPRNVGIENSTANYIMFLDSDDHYTDDACELLYNKIQDNDVDIVFGKYIVFSENTEIKVHYTFFNDLNEIKVNSIDENPQILEIAPSIWTKIYKREFLLENNLKFSENVQAEDLVFAVKTFLKANGIIFLNNRFVYNYKSLESGNSLSDYNISYKNMLKLVDGYCETYDLLKNSDKESFLPYIFNSHLQFWADEFIKMNDNKANKIKLLEKIGFLFEELGKYDVTQNKDYLVPLFNYIRNKKYSETVLISEALGDFIKSQQDLLSYQDQLYSQIHKLESDKNRLENELNQKKEILKLKEKEIAELKTVKGYGKYKANNVTVRLKKRIE